MPKFKIYAGLSGGFGGATLCCVDDFYNKKDAEDFARQEAIDMYESYGGCHGLYTWDSMRQEIADDAYDGDISQVDDEDVDIAYMEEIEGWITYFVKEAYREDDVIDDDDSDYFWT